MGNFERMLEDLFFGNIDGYCESEIRFIEKKDFDFGNRKNGKNDVRCRYIIDKEGKIAEIIGFYDRRIDRAVSFNEFLDSMKEATGSKDPSGEVIKRVSDSVIIPIYVY